MLNGSNWFNMYHYEMTLTLFSTYMWQFLFITFRPLICDKLPFLYDTFASCAAKTTDSAMYGKKTPLDVSDHSTPSTKKCGRSLIATIRGHILIAYNAVYKNFSIYKIHLLIRHTAPVWYYLSIPLSLSPFLSLSLYIYIHICKLLSIYVILSKTQCFALLKKNKKIFHEFHKLSLRKMKNISSAADLHTKFNIPIDCSFV